MVVLIRRCFTIFLILFLEVSQGLENKIVQTDVGSFQGTAANDGGYFQFLGIPYGQVDAANPFGAATEHPPISDTYIAIDDSIMCPQMTANGTITGSLDCLRLNVYVPSSATDASQLPVMVYIHGGFFQRSSGERADGPRFLVRHDVILVTILYRVGPYGFMCLNRRAVPGNQGLKDQILALKWIKNNIAAFGGNPDQVTLFGNSAGGHSIDLHLLSEEEKLYHGVIIQSGSSLAQTVNFEPDREAPTNLASYLQLEHSTVSEALTSLANAPTSEVIRAATDLNIEFKPCAETKFEDVTPFITEYWINSPIPKAQDLPIMIGFNEYEALRTHINAGSEHFQAIRDLVYNSLNHTFNLDEDRMSRMEGYMRRFYLADSAISQETAWQIINFESDYLYNHPIQRSIKKFAEANASNIFYYMFAYSGDRSAASVNNWNVQGAAHADELRYLFDMPSLPFQISTQDQVIIDRMTTMWTNFAKYGDPTPEVTTLLPVKWVPLDSIYHYLRIDSELSMARRPFNRRMAFWDLFLKVNSDYERSFEAATAAEDDIDSSSIIVTANLLNILVALTLAIAYKF